MRTPATVVQMCHAEVERQAQFYDPRLRISITHRIRQLLPRRACEKPKGPRPARYFLKARTSRLHQPVKSCVETSMPISFKALVLR